MKQAHSIRIVVTQAQLELAEHTNLMNVDRSLQPRMGLRVAGVDGRSQNETIRIALGDFNDFNERNANTRWIQTGVVIRAHLALRHLPAQQPGSLDAGGVHVFDHPGAVMTNPARMAMNVNNTA